MFKKKKAKPDDQRQLVNDSENESRPLAHCDLKSYACATGLTDPSVLQLKDNEYTEELSFSSEDEGSTLGDDSDPESTSGYGTASANGPRGELSRMYPSYSVPNLYSDGQLKAFAENPEIAQTQINSINNPRYVIIGSNSVLNDNKGAPESRDCSSLASSIPEKNIADRTKKIVQYIDSLQYKAETKQINEALSMLRNRNVPPLVIFKGPPGSGNHFTAKWLFAKLLKDNKDAIGYCLKDPNECCYINAEKKAVVLFLRANGRNGYNRAQMNDCHYIVEENMPPGLPRNDNITIIMTIQDYDEMKGHPLLSDYAKHVIDAREPVYRPSIGTLRQLTQFIATHHNVLIRRNMPTTKHEGNSIGSPIIVDKDVMDTIPSVLGRIGHIRRLNDFFRHHTADGIEVFRRPDPKYVQQIREYERDQPALFLILLAVYAHRGKLRVGRLEEMKHMNHHMDSFWQSVQNIKSVSNTKVKQLEKNLISSFPGGVLMIKYARKRGKMADLARTLEAAAKALDGVYLDEHNGVYEFLNGNTFFSFLVVLCQQYPEAIETCESDFFYKYVKPSYDSMNTDEYLVVDISKDDDIRKCVIKRFRKELKQRFIKRCMTHPVMLPQLFKEILSKKSFAGEILQEQDIDTKNPNTYIYYGMHNASTSENNTDVILRSKIWKEITKTKALMEWVNLHMNLSMMHAIELNCGATFKLFIERGCPLPITALNKAITYQCADIIDTIIDFANFTEAEWYKEVIHALEVMCSGECRFVEKIRKLVRKVDIHRGVKNDKDSPPILSYAVRTNNMKMIEILFEEDYLSSSSISYEYDGETAIQEASRHGYSSIVVDLLHRRDYGGRLPTDLGVHDHDLSVGLESLLSVKPCHLHDRETFLSLLFAVVIEGKRELVINLVEKYHRTVTIATDQTHRKHQSELSNAKGKCNRCNGWFLLNPLEYRGKDGKSALHVASEHGHTELVRHFIEKGLDVRAEDKDGESALSLACRKMQVGALKVILEDWKWKEYPTDERVVLRVVQEDSKQALDLLIQYGFEINFVNKKYGTPLIVAATHKLLDMLTFLLRKGADPNIMQDGSAPIHVTARNGFIDGFDKLKAFGADVSKVQGNLKQTIIHIAAQQLNTQYIEYVFRTGSDDDSIVSLINQKNARWETALHIAARQGCVELVKVLLGYGFNTKLPNKSGCLPEKLAQDGHNLAIRRKNGSEWNAYADCVKLLS